MGQLCEELGIPFELRAIPQAEVADADELLLSSASKEVLPVSMLDGRPIGSGKPGPIYDQLYAAYQRAKQRSHALESTRP
jgi:D-alanine transaminase